MSVRTRRVSVHGRDIGVLQVGASAGDEPPRPAVVLIHGLAGGAATWGPVLEELAERPHEYSFVAPDLIGHQNADYSLGGYANEVRDLLAALGHRSATIVGHSLGGGIALQFCYQYPHSCDRLVLVAAGGLGRELHPVLRAATLPGAELILPVLAHARVTGAAAWLAGAWRQVSARNRAGGSPSVDAYASLADSARRRAFVISARNVIDLAGQRVSGLDRMYLTSEMPTMAIWGGRDPIIPSSHGREAMAGLAQGRFELFELAGHFPHCDEPVRFANVLLDFLATTRPAKLDLDTVAARIATGRLDADASGLSGSVTGGVERLKGEE